MKQWYEIDPELLEMEKITMAKLFPKFTLNKLEDGRLYWIGEIVPIVTIPDVPIRTYTILVLYQKEHPHSVDSDKPTVIIIPLVPEIDEIFGAHTLTPFQSGIGFGVKECQCEKTKHIVTWFENENNKDTRIKSAATYIRNFSLWLTFKDIEFVNGHISYIDYFKDNPFVLNEIMELFKNYITSNSYSRVNLSKEELIKKLKELKEDESPSIFSMGAMCYSRSPMPRLQFECDICLNKITQAMYESSYNRIHKIVSAIHQLGYDVEIRDLCLNCLMRYIENEEYITNWKDFDDFKSVCKRWDNVKNNYIIEDLSFDNIVERLRASNSIYICFFFRTSESEKWHVAQSNNLYDYIAILTFLQNKKSFEGDFGRIRELRFELDLIKRMTGLYIPENDESNRIT